jgi:hypothetical protein
MLIPHKFKIYLEYKADKICIDPLVLVILGVEFLEIPIY